MVFSNAAQTPHMYPYGIESKWIVSACSPIAGEFLKFRVWNGNGVYPYNWKSMFSIIGWLDRFSIALTGVYFQLSNDVIFCFLMLFVSSMI